jgi:hypothetical protein
MNMNVIFCDIDGVLCLDGQTLDPIRLGLLKNVCSKGNASVVLSSTWRTLPNALQQVKDVFKVFDIPFVGITSDNGNRLDEILFWVEQNKPENWVVLDDWPLDDFNPKDDTIKKDLVLRHFVQTNKDVGFTERDAEKAISILTNKEFKFWNAFDEAKEMGAKW